MDFWSNMARLRLVTFVQADILLVTDGDVPYPHQALLESIRAAENVKGARLHGLLVTQPDSEGYDEDEDEDQRMRNICSHVHNLSAVSKSQFR